MNIQPGNVFRWANFPDARYGEKDKARWFICVGISPKFITVSSLYLCTTTTKLDNFKEGGSRSNHSHFIFKTKQFAMFEEDCAVDFSEKPYAINLSRIPESDIEIKGTLKEDTIRMIYKRLMDSGRLTQIQLIDIHESLNQIGITGLKKPKTRK